MLGSGSNEDAVLPSPETCGANFIASESDGVLNEQPAEKIQMIAGIYLGCMALAVIIVSVGVDSLTRYFILCTITHSSSIFK